MVLILDGSFTRRSSVDTGTQQHSKSTHHGTIDSLYSANHSTALVRTASHSPRRSSLLHYTLHSLHEHVHINTISTNHSRQITSAFITFSSTHSAIIAYIPSVRFLPFHSLNFCSFFP